MITSLLLENFKLFKYLEIPNLSRVTLIGGHNNVGKTTLLEALYTFYDRLNPEMTLRQFVRMGIDVVPIEPENIWAPIFLDYDMKKKIRISITKNNKVEIMTIALNENYLKTIPIHPLTNNKSKNMKINQQQIQFPTTALQIECTTNKKRTQLSHFVINNNGFGLKIDLATTTPQNAVFLSSRMHTNHNEDATRFGRLDIIGKQDTIVDFLKVLEPRLISLSSITMGEISLIHGDLGSGRKIPISFMGDGMSRLLSIILAIATNPNGLILIDEIENGIHYSVIKDVWKSIGQAAQEFNCQIFVTTHSYECIAAALEGFKGELENDFQYTRLDQRKDEIVAKIYDYEMLSTAIDVDMEVR